MADTSPWLHDEVASRMQERLDWIRLQPEQWMMWEPLRGGLQAHQALLARYTGGHAWVETRHAGRTEQALQAMAVPPAASTLGRLGARLGAVWRKPRVTVGTAPAGQMQMVWANMGLHAEPDPQAVLRHWHDALAVDGFLMFSCLGPDTLAELRKLYCELGWPAPAQPFTDMHDWGDMLLEAGFAEPVMDMEHITLSFGSPERLLQELRELGRNLAPGRAPGLRGRGWHAQLLRALAERGARTPQGALRLSFEVIYGHALKPAPRHRLAAETSIPLDAMRTVLRNKPGA
jgi:malonyl-CoA O-methyltransferase